MKIAMINSSREIFLKHRSIQSITKTINAFHHMASPKIHWGNPRSSLGLSKKPVSPSTILISLQVSWSF